MTTANPGKWNHARQLLTEVGTISTRANWLLQRDDVREARHDLERIQTRLTQLQQLLAGPVDDAQTLAASSSVVPVQQTLA